MTRGGEHPHVPFAVAGYIAGAYWFTSSTSFANPAVTVGRTLSDSFAGIAPASVPAFVAAQLVGGALAAGAVAVMSPAPPPAGLVHRPGPASVFRDAAPSAGTLARRDPRPRT